MRILLAITGGIAAYKAIDLVSALKKNDCHVEVMMTESAKLYCPVQALKVTADYYWEFLAEAPCHIQATENIDIFAVAPATANTISKIVYGIADNLVTCSVLALKEETQKIIFPAMNTRMLHNEVIQENLNFLKKRGWMVVSPVVGQLACGDVGEGKLPPTREIVAEILKIAIK